ncbi:MAG: NUDIX hydrolase [Pseudomonadota bacterium]
MTVSAVIEDAGRYLVVDEVVDGVRVINQPAGHLEAGESLLDAVVREVREETQRMFTPTAVTGVYRWTAAGGPTFLRVNFIGTVGATDPAVVRDPDILDTRWLGTDEIAAAALRSPLVLACIRDVEAGHRYPLELLRELA